MMKKRTIVVAVCVLSVVFSLASREAAAALVGRKLVPADAVQLPKEEYSDSTAWFPKSVRTSEGGTLVVYP